MENNIVKIMKDYVAAWNSHDVDKVVSFYTDDCVYEDMGLDLVSHGKKELTESSKTMFYNVPDIRFETKSLFNAGDWGAWEWIMTGTLVHSNNPAIPATGKSFSVRGVSIIEVKGGKISRETDYYNALTVLQQLGLMPATPSK
jgi:steroid delta-isomerase-like uncharacterized protein